MKLQHKLSMTALVSVTARHLIEYFELEGRSVYLPWKEYHGFPIAELSKFINNKDFLDVIRIDESQIHLQLGHCLSCYNGPNHYHDRGHQMILILGPESGFSEPNGHVTIGVAGYKVKEHDIYYFPPETVHGFRGDFYFVNLQNPPLLDANGNDDYHEVG